MRKLPEHITEFISLNVKEDVPNYVKLSGDGTVQDEVAKGIFRVGKKRGMQVMADKLIPKLSMKREDIERWTKLYIIQQCNQPEPDQKEVDLYIDESVEYFGSIEEYIKVLKWFFKLS